MKLLAAKCAAESSSPSLRNETSPTPFAGTRKTRGAGEISSMRRRQRSIESRRYPAVRLWCLASLTPHATSGAPSLRAFRIGWSSRCSPIASSSWRSHISLAIQAFGELSKAAHRLAIDAYFARTEDWDRRVEVARKDVDARRQARIAAVASAVARRRTLRSLVGFACCAAIPGACVALPFMFGSSFERPTLIPPPQIQALTKRLTQPAVICGGTPTRNPR